MHLFLVNPEDKLNDWHEYVKLVDIMDLKKGVNYTR